MQLDQLLRIALERGASDLHLKVGARPMIRVHGSLVAANDIHRISSQDTESYAATILTPAQREKLGQCGEIDLAYSVNGLGRFRCNVFMQRGAIGLVLRLLPEATQSLEALGMPPVIARICQEERGLILLAGTTGSGKTTTMAAMVDRINRERQAHVVTIEEPIEYLHRDHRSIVSQREVSIDTQSFASALRGAMRQDPDVILVGEMRDLETIETALHAAETGHLVMSTVQGLDATETIHRTLAVFPPHHQAQIRVQLAGLLKAVISQRLVPRADGTGRCVVAEIMVSTPFIRECIIDREKTNLIAGAIASGTSQYGMQTFDQSLFQVYRDGLVSYEEALRWAANVDEFKLKVHGVTNVTEMARDQMAGTTVDDSVDIERFSA